jgi:hypothetical protein
MNETDRLPQKQSCGVCWRLYRVRDISILSLLYSDGDSAAALSLMGYRTPPESPRTAKIRFPSALRGAISMA